MINGGWLLTDLGGGGAELLPLIIAPALKETSLTVLLLKDRVDHRIPCNGPHVVPLSSGERSLALTGATVLGRAVKSARRLDVLVAGLEWTPTFFAVASGALARRPVVATVHTDLRRYREYRPVPPLWWSAMRASLSRCVATVAVSEEVRESLLALGLPESRVHVIPNPSRLPPLVRTIKRRPARILTVSNLHRGKGIDVALDAASRLLDLDFEWVIVGDGTERQALIRQAEDLGISERITFAGFQADPVPFYHDSDLYVLPSRLEGFGIALLEAMSSGLPVVATRCGSFVEKMVDREVGALVENEDVDGLASALRSLLLEPSRWGRLGETAVRRTNAYQPERIAALYDDLLSSIVGECASRPR